MFYIHLKFSEFFMELTPTLVFNLSTVVTVLQQYYSSQCYRDKQGTESLQPSTGNIKTCLYVRFCLHFTTRSQIKRKRTISIFLLIVIWMKHTTDLDIDCYKLWEEQKRKRKPCWTLAFNGLQAAAPILCVFVCACV